MTGGATRDKGGRSWQIGTDAEWISRGTVAGLTVASAIPRVFEAYATVVVPELRAGLEEHEHHVVRLLSQQSTDVNLLDRRHTHRDDVLRFVTDLLIPATINGSEQDIRMVKIRMKVCGGLRTLGGARGFYRPRSYLSTARKQGQHALTAVLRMLCDGDAWMPAIPATTS